MAIALKNFSVTEVSKPRLGETKPEAVKAEVEIDLRQFGGVIREEWERIREHDVLFLVTIDVRVPAGMIDECPRCRVCVCVLFMWLIRCGWTTGMCAVSVV